MTPHDDVPVASLLLCDDSDAERGAVARLLRSAGYDVHEADNGRDALRFLKSHEIDLVLLDLNMPQVDGFGVLGYLQEHRRALPVLLLSGMSPNRIQTKIHTLPSHELPPLLLKPVDPDQLLSLVELGLSGELTVPRRDDESPSEH
ncbi:MAG TPA: response regulator [Humisphaera sp.]